ncbi:tetratricopeptide repeat protein [Microbulbifer sp. SH-1]|uniref:tetratricopeptide repeat-containing sulfotransferase family protein n=1 Tax=Microbulbifer sp. SH-1 TaxID=2681547 RepID=UPI00140BFBAE|nr:sulfotransferase [Microbulbifer sp. SH-1]QIL89951.1 tetratricopeptide repeat protein [Microbulbifer sp. SH-1]
MTFSANVNNELRKARGLALGGRFSEAESIYQKLASGKVGRESALRELCQLYIQWQKFGRAIDCVEQLAKSVSTTPEYWLQLAQLAQSVGNTNKAIEAYRRYFSKEPGQPNTVFNFAYMLRKAGYLEEAIDWYQKSLLLNISDKEEVYTNIGVIYSELRREHKAKEFFEKALDVRSDYIPAMLNLAAYFEELGEKDKASRLYNRALKIDDGCSLALCRLANMGSASESGDVLIRRALALVERAGISDSEAEELHFALGKLFDDCGSYDNAFKHYQLANQIGRKRFSLYDQYGHKCKVDALIQCFSREWFENHFSNVEDAPVFICGMFRSGSTLIEQVLSGHSRLTAGGENDFFPQLAFRMGESYPLAIKSMSNADLTSMGSCYMEDLRRRFPGADLITDKRPDNFLHVGLIKAVLPKSRFLLTRRGLLDNCLSVYFQQLGGGMNYSVDLEFIAHYYVEQVRLMTHWKCLFPDDILEIEYEEFVEDPEGELRHVLSFLGLPWETSCLEFTERSNYVKTASIWQVREGIHSRSTSRYQNYRGYLKSLEKYLAK